MSPKVCSSASTKRPSEYWKLTDVKCRLRKQQICCGALHAHAGDLGGARELARQNIEAFAVQMVESTHHHECGWLWRDARFVWTSAGRRSRSMQNVRSNSARVCATSGSNSNRSVFVTEQRSATSARRTMLRVICFTGSARRMRLCKMLWAIPDLKFAHSGRKRCLLWRRRRVQPARAQLLAAVLDEKLKHINESGAEVLATGNPGCHMQIAAGAKLAGMTLRVCHPVELLDESYARAGFYNKESFKLIDWASIREQFPVTRRFGLPEQRRRRAGVDRRHTPPRLTTTRR